MPIVDHDTNLEDVQSVSMLDGHIRLGATVCLENLYLIIYRVNPS